MLLQNTTSTFNTHALCLTGVHQLGKIDVAHPLCCRRPFVTFRASGWGVRFRFVRCKPVITIMIENPRAAGGRTREIATTLRYGSDQLLNITSIGEKRRADRAHDV